MLTVGTVADERFPVISIDMSRPEILALFATAAGIDMGEIGPVGGIEAKDVKITITKRAIRLVELRDRCSFIDFQLGQGPLNHRPGLWRSHRPCYWRDRRCR